MSRNDGVEIELSYGAQSIHVVDGNVAEEIGDRMVQQVAGGEYFFDREVDNGVSGGIASPKEPDLYRAVPEIDVEFPVEGDIRDEFDNVLEFCQGRL